MIWRNIPAAGAAAAAALAALASAAPAGAQSYGYYEFAGDPYVDGYYAPPPRHYGYRSGPADPCAREAGNRALGWGLAGLLLGGLAGGAAAGAGVVAEGAALGGFVGAVTGATAGSASAACGTARYSGLPVYGSSPRGVAVYHRPLYDHGAAYTEPYPYYGGGHYDRGYYGGDYYDGGGYYGGHRQARRHDCCYDNPRTTYYRRSYRYERHYDHRDYAERDDYEAPGYDDYDDYREPRN